MFNGKSEKIERKLYQSEFVVEGIGDFPFDMLRYERAFPEHESDSYKLNTSDEKRSVYLIKIHHDPEPEFNHNRWKSFGWKITQVNEKVVKK